MRAFERGQRARDVGVGGEDVRVVERGDDERMRGRIGHADHDRFRFAEVDGVDRHLECDAE